ncbi:MAG: hypothetical protein KAS59_02665, partial [Alphaproteobacteria bacterium]|nr:hypothetical protein [Alphaproteobacteria bacterium]
SGIWSDSVYRLSLTAGANDTQMLDIKENYVKVEGLQISLTNSGGYTGCKAVNIDSQVTASEISLNSNILKGIITEATSEGRGIYANDTDITAKIYNNIIYDFVNTTTPTTNEAGIETATGGTYYLYNNSLIDNYSGINIGAGIAVAKNNLVKGSGDANAYIGTFSAGTDYNATDGTDDIGQGLNNKTEQTFSFVNESIDDFHLALTDSGAKDSGTDLSNDSNISFADDIDSETHLDTWDIGADEEMTVTWDGSESSNWTTGANWAGGAAPTSANTVIIDGNYTNAPILDLTSGTTTIKGLSLGENNASVLTLSNGNATTNKLVVTGDVDIGANGTLSHTANTTAQTHTINLEAVNFSIASGGTIDVTQKGYNPCVGPGAASSTNSAGGAAYGGNGGDGALSVGGSSYGSISQPASIGSGGGQSTRGGSGGGAVKLVISNTTTIDGNISANGQGGINDYGGGGSGGAVWIDTGTLSGAGMVITNGGNGYNTNEGGGGGGRIAVYYTIDSSTVSYQAYGGLEGTLTTRMGGAGTIYKKSAAQTNGDLTIDNNDQDHADETYMGKSPLIADWTFDNVTISGAGKLDANGYNL